MKTNLGSSITFVLVLAGCVALAAGCSTVSSVTKKTGIERAEKTTASMQTVETDIRQANLQIDLTKASLESLLKVGQMSNAQAADVKTAFDTFSENADKMKEVGKNLNSHIDEMNSQGNAYFTEWAKEGGTYTNPQIQKLSENRRAHLSNTFREMEMSAANVRPNLNSYMSDIEQVQKYLSNDLTPQGIAAIIPVARNVEKDGAKLKRSLVPVEKSIMSAQAELTAGGAAAGGSASRSTSKSSSSGVASGGTTTGGATGGVSGAEQQNQPSSSPTPTARP